MLRPHLEVEKRIIRYLKCLLEKVFDIPLIDIHPLVSAYEDADWAGSPTDG